MHYRTHPAHRPATRGGYLQAATHAGLVWLAFALFSFPLPGTLPSDTFARAEESQAPPVVTVTIDYGDGVQKRFTAIRWKPEMTVLDAMEAAEKHPRGIRMTYRGSQSTALLTGIDDLKNEGRGRNWIYRVDGKLADRSFGVRELDAGAEVLWRFEKYRAGARE